MTGPSCSAGARGMSTGVSTGRGRRRRVLRPRSGTVRSVRRRGLCPPWALRRRVRVPLRGSRCRRGRGPHVGGRPRERPALLYGRTAPERPASSSIPRRADGAPGAGRPGVRPDRGRRRGRGRDRAPRSGEVVRCRIAKPLGYHCSSSTGSDGGAEVTDLPPPLINTAPTTSPPAGAAP